METTANHPRFFRRGATLLACLTFATSSVPAAAANVVPITITVRVYQRADLRPGFGQRAQAETETILRSARVNTIWRICQDPHPGPACHAPLAVREVVLRIADEGPRSEALSLGKALVIPPSGGLLATVYATRVARAAKQARTDVEVLLGRVAAHEIGHLIMNTSGHSPRGLMRATWTSREVRRNRPADWVFTAADRAAMDQRDADVLTRRAAEAGGPYGERTGIVRALGVLPNPFALQTR